MTPRAIGKDTVVYQALLLGGCAALAATLLMVGDRSTSSAIAERKKEDMLESLSQVLPRSRYDNDLLASSVVLNDTNEDPVKVYAARLEGKPTGFAFRATGAGYAGPIELLLGVDANGELLGVRVLAHTETPGLGDAIDIAKDDWILGFDGRSLRNTSEKQWRVRKDGGDIDALTGATVTPRAVVRAVYEGLLFFEEHRAILTTSETSDYDERRLAPEEGS